MSQASSISRMLVEHLQGVYLAPAWHGPSLRGSLKGLKAAVAFKCSTGAGHSIADIVLHCAYWKYAVRRKFESLERGAFPFSGSNWFQLKVTSNEKEWSHILQVLDEQHALLVQAIERFAPAQWHRKAPGSRYSYQQLVLGIAAHDVFHAGQIRMLKPKRKSMNVD
ncbi:MAG: DinB family protein [Gemmatales bacterium]